MEVKKSLITIPLDMVGNKLGFKKYLIWIIVELKNKLRKVGNI